MKFKDNNATSTNRFTIFIDQILFSTRDLPRSLTKAVKVIHHIGDEMDSEFDDLSRDLFLVLSTSSLDLSDTVHGLTLGRDWFNYCTTSAPDARKKYDMRLIFSSSPFSAVCLHHTCEFLLL